MYNLKRMSCQLNPFEDNLSQTTWIIYHNVDLILESRFSKLMLSFYDFNGPEVKYLFSSFLLSLDNYISSPRLFWKEAQF